tara:strand:+ start:2756 stop:6226 length:3471 start_codon:yes stop_codon:yes gene_type:complete
MANSGNRVFVSPGVYTSEKDLSFVAQSVGVTTLGLVGEALKGPAFEPIFIKNYDDFITRFGGTSPTTYVDSQIPKYELGYIAKSYLSQSNQLFVTRVLGISGYDAGPSWSVQTIGRMDPTTFSSSVSAVTSGTTRLPFFIPLTGAGTTVGSKVFSNVTLTTDFLTTMPGSITPHFSESITLNNGSTLPTLNKDVLVWFEATLNRKNVGLANTLCTLGSAGTECVVSAGTSNGTIYQYGPIPKAMDFFATATTHNALFASGNTLGLQGSIGGTSIIHNRLGVDGTALTSGGYPNEAWYYALFDYTGSTTCCSGTTYSGAAYQLYLSAYTKASGLSRYIGGDDGRQVPLVTGTTNAGGLTGVTVYSGVAIVDTVTYNGVKPYSDWDNMVVLTLRSRGISDLNTGGPQYDISGDTVVFDCSGTYAKVLEDPFASFGLSARTNGGNNYTYKVDMTSTSQEFAPRVLGISPFDKNREEVPLFVEESYPNLLLDGYRRGKIRGLQCCLTHLPAARHNNANLTSIGWYMNQWQTPATPWVVSELQGTDVFRLFKFISISDGSAANREYKVSLSNLSFERGEFDILVRDFRDSDARPNVLEKFTRCSLDPTRVSFIGRKVGTSTGEFALNSNYIMIQLGDGVLDGTYTGSLPCGFEGYRFRQYSTCALNPFIQYKTRYYNPGQIVYDPPFGTGTVNNPIRSGGDNVSRTYLGISDTQGAAYDTDFFSFKGRVTPSSVCTDTEGDYWPVITQGFHMDSGATVVIAGQAGYLEWSGTTLSGKQVFQVGAGKFRSEPKLSTNPYKKLRSRKFTLAPHDGFDGWDIYRKTRSNTDDYRLGLTGYLNGSCVSIDYPTAKGGGTFKALSSTEGNTDYYAYLRGINEFSNPEAVDINVFATPGIDYVDNLGLVNEAIDMVETDRADSLYVVTTPDYNMYVKNTNTPTDQIGPTEAVNNIEDSLIDSNYTATYYPWIQVRDTANNKQLYIPPTSEVMRNIALTDNIAFPWFASAGYTRGLVQAVRARKKLTLDERDTLYVGRLNPIATFSDTGPIIWGNKTLQLAESALDRVNVRRLLLQTRKLISAVAVRLIFEQNDEIVRQQFLDLVNPILDSIRRDRGLTDFRVVLSNDPQEIDRNEMNGKIYIKPTRALEYIYVEFLITPTGASFEDI